MEDCPNFLRFEDPEQHYQMLEFIGEGNFGTVLKIKDKVTEELFALKIIPMDLEVLEQIIPDLVELKKIDNPFFLNYYDIFYKDQNLWIVMEYCEFGAITEIPKLLNRFLKEEEVGPIIFQILNGLHYLHTEMKVDHLAIKPTNILIDQYGRIKISDYGLTFKFLKNLVDFENLLQCAHYLSPEMTENSPKISFKSDIWCLGITIIELLQGTPPFVMMNNSQVLEKLKSQTDNFQLEQKDQFSTAIQQLIEKCLKNEIDERPSAQEILDSDQFLQQFKNTNVNNDTNSGVLKPIIEQIYETANGEQQTQQNQQSQENLSQIISENVDQIQGGKKQSELQDIQENLSYSNFSQNQGQLKSTDGLQKPQNQQDQLFSSKLFENLSCASRENQSQKIKESQTLQAKNKEQGIIDNLESNISLSLDQNELEPRSEQIQNHSNLQKSDIQKSNQKSKTNFSQNQSQQSKQQIENNKNLQNSQNSKINKESISENELEQQQQQELIRQKYFEEQKKEQEERAKRLQELEKQYNQQNYSEINLSDMDDVDNTSQQNNNQSQKSSQQYQEKQKRYLSISGLNESQQKISEDQQRQLSQNQNLSQRKTNKQDLSENPMNDPLGEYEEYIQESFENYSNNNSENFQNQGQKSNNNLSQQKFQGHHLVQSEHSFAKKEKQKKSISNISDQNSVSKNKSNHNSSQKKRIEQQNYIHRRQSQTLNDLDISLNNNYIHNQSKSKLKESLLEILQQSQNHQKNNSQSQSQQSIKENSNSNKKNNTNNQIQSNTIQNQYQQNLSNDLNINHNNSQQTKMSSQLYKDQIPKDYNTKNNNFIENQVQIDQNLNIQELQEKINELKKNMQNEINIVIDSYKLRIVEVQKCISEKQKNIQQNNLQEQLQNQNSDDFYTEEYFENLKLKLGQEIQNNQLQLNNQINQENSISQKLNLQDQQGSQLQAINGKESQDNLYNINNNDIKNKLQQENKQQNSPNQGKKSQQEILKQIANLPFNFQVDDELTEQLNLLEYQQYMEKQQYIQQIHQSQAKKKALPFEFAPLIQGQNQYEDQNYQQYMEQNQKKLRNNLNDPSSLVGQNGNNKLSQQQQVQQNQQNNCDSQYQQKKQLPFSFQPAE